MPELPEVETTKNGIAPHCANKKVRQLIIRNPNLRWPVDPIIPDKIQDKKILSITRRGKYLLFHFENGTLLWHLGMSGSLRVVKESATPNKHDHIDLIINSRRVVRYCDPRRFGALVWTEANPETHKLIEHLGPEPLTDDFSGEYLYSQSRKRKQAVKGWLMDSKVVVGVGNIYANESLFLAGIHPLKAAGKLTRPQAEKLCTVVKQVLGKAIEQGGTTLRDFVGGDGQPGYFKQQLFVYDRGGLPCKTCNKILLEKQINQRTTVYCTHCQK